jgi:hypothetical protein
MRIKRHVRNDVEKEECVNCFLKHFLGDILFPFLKIVQKEGCMHTLLEEKGHALTLDGLGMEEEYQ